MTYMAIFFKNMDHKCCVTNGNGNYDKSNREKHLDCLKNKMKNKDGWLLFLGKIYQMKDIVVCERRWPPGYPTAIYYGKRRSVNPLSVCVKTV